MKKGNPVPNPSLQEAEELQVKIAKEFKLDKAIKRAKWEKEFDQWFNKLGKKNGYTNY